MFRRIFNWFNWLGIGLIVLTALCLSTCTVGNRVQGYVYYRLGSSPSTLDPALVVDVTGGQLTAKLFNGLVRLGPGLEVQPDIASGWSISKDGLTYTFMLKKGVQFSNGREVRAHDFKYSFERVLNPKVKSPNTWIFDKVAGAREYMKGEQGGVVGISAHDDYTLEITLSSPFAPFLGLLSMPPAYVVPEEEVERWGPDFSSRPTGTGPFVLAEWLPGRHLRLDAREDYFDKPARVKGIFYRIIPEEMTAVMEFEVGNLDVLSIPASEYSRYKNSPKWSGLIDSIDGINTYYLGLNCSRPPFDDTELRRALNYAIDVKKILDTLYEARGSLASGPVPNMLRRWPAPERYRYDPERAKKIISLKKPRDVDFYITADPQVVDIAEVIQAYLKDAGLKVRLRQLEWSAFKEAVNKGEADMFWLSWWADYPDSENFLFPLFHSSNHGPAGNRARYTNREVDALIEAGQVGDGPRRKGASKEDASRFYEKAEGIIVGDAPWVFFWHRRDYTLRQPWVKNHKLYLVYSMDKGTDISL